MVGWFRSCSIGSWMVIVFVVLTLALFFQTLHRRNVAFSELSARINELEQTKKSIAEERDDLQRQLQSESDPAFVEMVLMKELGVVPEGWTKVHFQKNHE